MEAGHALGQAQAVTLEADVDLIAADGQEGSVNDLAPHASLLYMPRLCTPMVVILDGRNRRCQPPCTSAAASAAALTTNALGVGILQLTTSAVRPIAADHRN